MHWEISVNVAQALMKLFLFQCKIELLHKLKTSQSKFSQMRSRVQLNRDEKWCKYYDNCCEIGDCGKIIPKKIC